MTKNLNRLILIGLVGFFPTGHAETTAEAPAPWPKSTLGVLVELESSYAEQDGFGEDSARDSSVATIAFSLDAALTEQVQVRFSTLYEEGATPSEVDEAFITLGNPEASAWQLTLGQLYLPFGAFDTALIADPYTLELGEARETAFVFTWQQDSWAATGYFSRGDLTDADGAARTNGGLRLDYQQGDDQQGWLAGLSYTRNLADSDGITAALEEQAAALTAQTSGIGLNLTWHQAPWHVLGEYVSATEALDGLVHQGAGAQPSPGAWNWTMKQGSTTYCWPSRINIPQRLWPWACLNLDGRQA